MPYVVYNVDTGSCVSHTESGMGVKPYDMVWETQKEAARHAYTLGVEYSFSHPHLELKARTWKIREATPAQVARAKFVGAFGKDYEDVIGTGQTRAHIKDTRNLPEKVKADMEQKVEDFRNAGE